MAGAQLAIGNSTKVGIGGVVLYNEYGYRFTKLLEALAQLGFFHSVFFAAPPSSRYFFSYSALLASANLNAIVPLGEKGYLRAGGGLTYRHANETYGLGDRGVVNGQVLDDLFASHTYRTFGYNVSMAGGVALSSKVDLGGAFNTYNFVRFGEILSLGVNANYWF